MQTELTDARRTELATVNVALNAAIKGKTDKELYGQAEFWAEADAAGDCEDYALAKRKALRAVGWPAESLDIAVCRLPSSEYHAVLIAHTSEGDLVLDNLNTLVRRWDHVPYSWISSSVDGSLKNWREIV